MPFLSTNELNTLTRRNMRETIIDQVYTSATYLAILRARKRLVLEDGGSIISQPILVNNSGDAQSFLGMDVLETTSEEDFSNYELQWKQATASCVISNRDKRRNQGRSQQFNLLYNKQEKALLDLVAFMAGQAYTDGTGNDGKDWDGIAASINNAAGYQVYLGIDRALNPWWQANVFDPGTPTPLSTGSMLSLYLACSQDVERPDLITTSKAVYGIYMSMLQPGERYVTDYVGGLGFENIGFMGQPIVEDSHNPAATMYFHQLEHERMVLHEDENFRFGGFQKPIAQDGEVGRWFVMGNFENRKPRSTGVYRNIQNG